MKNSSSILIIGVMLAVAIIVAAILMARNVGATGLQLIDLPVSSASEVLKKLQDGRTTIASSMFADDLRSLVGLIVRVPVRDAAETGTSVTLDRFNADPRFRPVPAKLTEDSTRHLLFEGRVKGTLSLAATTPIISATGASEQIAELVIADALMITYRDKSEIPLQELSTIPLDPAFNYYFIESVILTTVANRLFQEVSAEAPINGTVMSVNGRFYQSAGALSSDWLASVIAFDLRRLRPGEGGTGPPIDPSILRDPRLAVPDLARRSQADTSRDLAGLRPRDLASP